MFIAIRSIYKKYLQIFPRSEALCVACGCLANPSGLSGPLYGLLANLCAIFGRSRSISAHFRASRSS